MHKENQNSTQSSSTVTGAAPTNFVGSKACVHLGRLERLPILLNHVELDRRLLLLLFFLPHKRLHNNSRVCTDAMSTPGSQPLGRRARSCKASSRRWLRSLYLSKVKAKPDFSFSGCQPRIPKLTVEFIFSPQALESVVKLHKANTREGRKPGMSRCRFQANEHALRTKERLGVLSVSDRSSHCPVHSASCCAG